MSALEVFPAEQPTKDSPVHPNSRFIESISRKSFRYKDVGFILVPAPTRRRSTWRPARRRPWDKGPRTST